MTTIRRNLALVASLLMVVLAAVAATSPASARPVDERCAGDAPLAASALAGGVSWGCSLAGRTVYDGDVAVVVPPPGMTVAGDGVGTHGEVVGLQVSNTGNEVRAVIGARTRSLAGVAGHAAGRAAADPAACRDRTFHLEGHRWRSPLHYATNLARLPHRLAAGTVVRQIKEANANLRTGRNTCGKPRIDTPAAHYDGRTSATPNIKTGRRTLRCGAFNTKNVVGFGNLPGDLLGWTCYWWVGSGQMGGADMMLDNGTRLVTSFGSACRNKWDLEGTVTHEFGHVYGMGHTGNGHSNLTMEHVERPCSSYARTLGLGDWLGMKKMYGVR